MQQRAGIAQLVEQRTENPRARGSSPRPGIYQNPAIGGVLSCYPYLEFFLVGVNLSIIPVYIDPTQLTLEPDSLPICYPSDSSVICCC